MKKIQREDIIAAAGKVISEQGLQNFTARKVASELNASTKPIYDEFGSMEKLKQELFKGIHNHFKDYIFQCDPQNPSVHHICVNFVSYAATNPIEFNDLWDVEPQYLVFTQYCVKKLILKEICRTELNDIVVHESDRFWELLWPVIFGLAMLHARGLARMDKEQLEKQISFHIEQTIALIQPKNADIIDFS